MKIFRLIFLSAHAAMILAGASLMTATSAQAIQCSAERPSNARTYWSYRLIDGRKCWYEGKPMLSKASLHWAPSRSAANASRTESSITPANKFNLLDAQASIPSDPVTEPKVEAKVEMADAAPAPDRSLTPDNLRAWGEGTAALAAKPIVTIIDRWPDKELPQQATKAAPGGEASRVNSRAIMTTGIAFLAILAVLLTVFKTLGGPRRRVGLQLLDR
jgi:hypothetical protein